MFKVVKFELEHVKEMLEEPMNSGLSYFKDNDYHEPKRLASLSFGLTGMIGNKPMVCAFLVPLWRGRGYAAFVFSEQVAKHSIRVYRGMKDTIPNLPFDRLEFDCPADFELGQRRALMMGFKVMCPLAKKYLPDGRDAVIYEWVRQ
jgi:hypothetical protein